MKAVARRTQTTTSVHDMLELFWEHKGAPKVAQEGRHAGARQYEVFDSGMSIHQLRKNLQMNQREFWTKIGVSQPWGSRYENSERVPRTIELLVTLAYGPEDVSGGLLSEIRHSPI